MRKEVRLVLLFAALVLSLFLVVNFGSAQAVCGDSFCDVNAGENDNANPNFCRDDCFPSCGAASNCETDGLCDSVCSGDVNCPKDPDCTPTTVCGNGVCESGESCSADCLNEASFCTDGVDNDQDGFADCYDADCITEPVCQGFSYCGNSVCDPSIGENDLNCPSDCPPVVCGDGQCVQGESCSADCSSETYCHDGVDNDQDLFADCTDADCQSEPVCVGAAFCGDLACQPGIGENSAACPSDCFVTCGDGFCDVNAGENNPPSSTWCPLDCGGGTACGDSICDLGEACVADCPGETHCSDNVDNNQNGLTDCQEPSCSTASNCAGAVCGNGIVESGEICDPPGSTGTGCGFFNGISLICDSGCQTCANPCGNGFCDTQIGEDQNNCPSDCGTCSGGGICVQQGTGSTACCSGSATSGFGICPQGQDVCTVPSCSPNPPGSFSEVSCTDGIDNDCDSFIDCAEFFGSGVGDCGNDPACAPPPPPPPENCTNGVDDDNDGLIDLADPNCQPKTISDGFDGNQLDPDNWMAMSSEDISIFVQNGLLNIAGSVNQFSDGPISLILSTAQCGLPMSFMIDHLVNMDDPLVNIIGFIDFSAGFEGGPIGFTGFFVFPGDLGGFNVFGVSFSQQAGFNMIPLQGILTNDGLLHTYKVKIDSGGLAEFFIDDPDNSLGSMQSATMPNPQATLLTVSFDQFTPPLSVANLYDNAQILCAAEEAACTDEDNDGLNNEGGDCGQVDQCPSVVGSADRNGCPVADSNFVELHIIDRTTAKTYCSSSGSCKSPISDAEVRVFNRNDHQFQTAYGTKNPSGTIYNQVFENGVGLISSCTTDNSGNCVAGETSTGDYLVIVKHIDAETGKTVYTGKPKSPGDFANGLAFKDFQIIKVYKKDGTIEFKGGDKTVITGSKLEVVYPQVTIWEDGEELYPFIFTADSSWTVDVCLQMPQGYQIAGSSCEQAFVSAGESKVILFTTKEVGSPEPNAKFDLTAKTSKGRQVKVSKQIDGLKGKHPKANKIGNKITGRATESINNANIDLSSFISEAKKEMAKQGVDLESTSNKTSSIVDMVSVTGIIAILLIFLVTSYQITRKR